MNGTTSTVSHGELHETRSLRAVAGGGSLVEAIGGIATIVLSIIGLAGGRVNDMLAISTIVLGASLVLEGGAIAASYRRGLFAEGEENLQLGSASSVECMAGFTGIVLGILALIGVGGGGALNHFVSAAVIVFGASLLLASAATRLGGQMLIGLSAVVLGILAVLGINAVMLNLVALLALGVSVLLSGTLFGARTMFEKREHFTERVA